MRQHTANYSYSNHNFVIQNQTLEGKGIENDYFPAICILKNILQRGKPTLLSTFLQERIGAIHKWNDFKKPYPLIDKESPKWERVIKGDEEGNYFPAQKFYEEIPKHFPEFEFIQQLLMPEVQINTITQTRDEVKEFENQQVDFYLPQAYLVIEIDGQHHEEQQEKDSRRDSHLEKYGIQTIRIKTSDLKNGNETFAKKIREIEQRIKKAMQGQKISRKHNNTFISLDDYKTAFEKGVDLSDPNYLATAIMRFQILVLELLEKGQLQFDRKWEFEIIERDVKNFAELAVKDLFEWFKHLLQLQKIKFKIPKFTITSVEKFTNNSESIKVDFSLLRRFTDEFQTQPEVFFVRTHYLDEFRWFKKGNSNKLEFAHFKDYDYFKVSTHEPIKYDLKLGNGEPDQEALRLLLWDLFLQSDESLEFNTLEFREGQLPIIQHALARNDTLGLLPTGAGKSVCYQLASILQPAVSFVVCPIKSLMYDQKADLDSVRFTRTTHITSGDDSEERNEKQIEFSKGKYNFILVSPERFQIKAFRAYLKSVDEKFTIAYAVIDEIHCLSEWGHDFRLSYLHLASNIRNNCSKAKFLGLTATASVNVLEDIQVELSIKGKDIKTLEDYTRRELDFTIIDDIKYGGNKYNAVVRLLTESIGPLGEKGKQKKCGIIFTPIVNTSKGCYALSQDLRNKLDADIKFFSGAKPKKWNGDEKQFEEYKKRVQTDFKENEFPLLIATKSFAMGLNKGNIYYTIHYGIPQSMEALYQEAGRAGRDKKKFAEGREKAQCFVLFTKSHNQKKFLDEIWNKQTTVPRLKELQQKVTGDVNTNLFLFGTNLDTITEEFLVTRQLYQLITCESKRKLSGENIKYQVKGKRKQANGYQTEKAIYRLNQLGVIEDWTIDYTKRGGIKNPEFEIMVANSDEECIKKHLMETIRKYEKKSFEEIDKEHKENFDKLIAVAETKNTLTNKCIFYLLQWVYFHFAYNRKQSLKDLYEYCRDVIEGKMTKEQFKLAIEYYFKISPLSRNLHLITKESEENPTKWFEVFKNLKLEKKIFTVEVGGETFTQENLKATLSRFVESYRDNTGLNMISGSLRLLLDDYENTDGRIRLESALREIKNYKQDKVDSIIGDMFKIGKQMDEKNKALLAESLHKCFYNQEFLIKLSKELNDCYSKTKLVESANRRIKKILHKEEH